MQSIIMQVRLSCIHVCLCLCFTALAYSCFCHPDIGPLIAFKRSITDDPLRRLSNWNAQSLTPCSWAGISCSSANTTQQGRVSAIDLSNASLQGNISAELANLPFLQLLNLSVNQFSGSIPPSLFRHPSIENISFKYNALSGPMPPFGGNCKLVRLDLSCNSVTGVIPASLLNCTELESLQLAHNNISGEIPNDIGFALPRLKCLSLAYNELGGTVPASIGKLSGLVKLELAANNLSGSVWPFLLNCKELNVLKLSMNKLSGSIPTDIGYAFPKLRNLSCYGNHFTGSVPTSLANCAGLLKLDLAENKLSGNVPSALANCTNLTEIRLSRNKLSGSIPAELGIYLRSLKVLSLSKNGLTGRIPESIGSASDLELIDLSDNNLEGVIPVSLARLPKLQYLLLAHNNLVSGITKPEQTIPLLEAFNTSNELQSLHLHENRLTGILPVDMGSVFKSLQCFNVSFNSISGTIPASLGCLSNLMILDLSANNFSGAIPSELGSLSSLKQLNLSENRLQGEIPKELGRRNTALSSLDLSNNQLSGSIPPSIGNLRSLCDLFLNNNSLSGGIPPELWKCTNLARINLSRNRLSGSLSPQITGQSNLWYLNISFNRFGGILPDSMGTNIDVADLSNNQFIGVLPKWASEVSSANFSNNHLGKTLECRLELDPNSDRHVSPSEDCRGGPFPSTNNLYQRTLLLIAIFFGLFVLAMCAGYLIIFLAEFSNKAEDLSPEEARQEGDQKFMLLSETELEKATDHYSPYNFLGRGSFGFVYRGTLCSGITVAIKIFCAAQEHEAERSFLRECETMGPIRHRNLVKIITAYSSQRMKALVMEYMANGSLHDLLHVRRQEDGKLTPLSLSCRVRLLREIASPLSYLHHDCIPPVVHCDLKPRNVLLDEEMSAHISDFGVARIVTQTDISATFNVEGSIGYIAPEYGVGKKAWSNGDVYSFGVVALEVMTRVGPTHPILGAEFTLSSWVSMALERGPAYIREVMIAGRDGQEELQSMSDHEYAVFVELLKLGLWCSSQDPEQRPTMRKADSVLEILSGFQRRQGNKKFEQNMK